MHSAKRQHPPSTAPDQTRCRATSATLHVLVKKLPLQGNPPGAEFGGQSLTSDATLTLDRAFGHDRHPKTKENRKQWIGAAVDEQRSQQEPPLIHPAHCIERHLPRRGIVREEANPEWHVRQSNQGQHKAAGDVRGGETHPALASERQGGHESSFRGRRVARQTDREGRGRRRLRGSPLSGWRVSAWPPSWLPAQDGDACRSPSRGARRQQS